MSEEKERPSCLNIDNMHTVILSRWFGKYCETESVSEGHIYVCFTSNVKYHRFLQRMDYSFKRVNYLRTVCLR